MNRNFIVKCGIVLLVLIFVGYIGYSLSKGSYAADEIENTSEISSENIDFNCYRFEGNETIVPNDEFVCELKAENVGIYVSSIEAKLQLGSNLTLESGEYKSWEGSVDNGNIALYTDVNKTGNFSIAKFKLKTADVADGFDTNITLQNIIVGNENFEEIKVEDVTKEIKVYSNINTLDSLVVDGVNIDLNSNLQTNTYNLTIDKDKINIIATKTSSKSIVVGDGEQELKYGKNTFEVIVTSESGVEKVYTLNITRSDHLSFDENIIVDSDNKILTVIPTSKDGLNINDFINMVDTSGNVTLVDENNGKVDGLLVTGYKLKIDFTSDEPDSIYKIVVKGDANGDGVVSAVDVSMMFQYYRGTNEDPIENISIMAGDVVNNDGEIKLTDVAKLFQYVRGTIDSLE